MQLIKQYIPKPWKLKFYIYYHPSMNLAEAIGRAEWCRSHEALPYFMRDQACWECEDKDFLTDYAAYCNQPAFFKKMDFRHFLEKRHKNQDRIERSWAKYVEATKGENNAKD